MTSPIRQPQHVLLASVGTDGDIYPFLGLGIELRARGYEVTLATHEEFADRATRAGIGFRSLISNGEFQEVLRRPEFWRPIRGPIVLARWGARLLSRQYEILSALAAATPTILVASPGVLVARLVQERLGIPLASVILQPWMVPSLSAPPTMMGGLTLPRWAPRPAGRMYLRLMDGVGALLVGRELNRLRASLGLNRMRRMFQWWFSPELVVGMFPEWFGEPQPDWPAQIKLAGFPVHDARSMAGLPADTLEFCGAGSPPVAFTFGTGMMHAAALFQSAVEACRRIGARAVLLTKFDSQLARNLPAFAHRCAFAPFHELFPRCAAVVHHGGIGTVAGALTAGTPQLILPFAFDQMDNALRVQRLGAGDWLKGGNRCSAAMAAALSRLTHPEAMVQARALAMKRGAGRGFEQAADLIEEWRSAGASAPG